MNFQKYIKERVGFVSKDDPGRVVQDPCVVLRSGEVCIAEYNEKSELTVIESADAKDFLIDVFNWARVYALNPDRGLVWAVNEKAPLSLSTIRYYNGVHQDQAVAASAYRCISVWLTGVDINKGDLESLFHYEELLGLFDDQTNQPETRRYHLDYLDGHPCIVYDVSSFQELVAITLMHTPVEMAFKECPVCGKAFIPVRSDQVYCSKQCKNKSGSMHNTNPYFKAHRSACTQYNNQVSKSGDEHHLREKYYKWLDDIRETTKEHMHYYEMSTKLSATAKLEDELLEKTFPDWGDKRYMSVDEYKTWIRKRWKEIKDGE